MNIITCCLFAALNVTVGELPPCDYADTECSTNFQVAVDFATMSRFEFTLALDASPSNSVEVAIGTDADGDGNLSVEESAYAFGYDCGTWFCRDTAKDRLDTLATVPVATLSPTNRIERTFALNRHKVKSAWNLAKVTRRGSAPIGESASTRGMPSRLQALDQVTPYSIHNSTSAPAPTGASTSRRLAWKQTADKATRRKDAKGKRRPRRLYESYNSISQSSFSALLKGMSIEAKDQFCRASQHHNLRSRTH